MLRFVLEFESVKSNDNTLMVAYLGFTKLDALIIKLRKISPINFILSKEKINKGIIKYGMFQPK